MLYCSQPTNQPNTHSNKIKRIKKSSRESKQFMCEKIKKKLHENLWMGRVRYIAQPCHNVHERTSAHIFTENWVDAEGNKTLMQQHTHSLL